MPPREMHKDLKERELPGAKLPEFKAFKPKKEPFKLSEEQKRTLGNLAKKERHELTQIDLNAAESLYASVAPKIEETPQARGQFEFSEIDRFFEKQKQTGADLVIGYYKKRQVSKTKIITSRLWEALVYVMFRLHVRDIDCGFKMFNIKAVEAMSPLRSEGAMISTEILVKAKRKKLKISEVGVNHYPREFGEQNGSNLAVITRAVLESLILWWDIRNGRF